MRCEGRQSALKHSSKELAFRQNRARLCISKGSRAICGTTQNSSRDACCPSSAQPDVARLPRLLVQAPLLAQLVAGTALAETAAPAYPSSFTPGPVEVGWQIWFGFFVGVFPFVIGAWEFGKRIIIQRRCQRCSGKGLVSSSREGSQYLRKCPECGGFFPWVSWKLFLTSTAAPGNGGPLLQPKGQTSVFYKVPPPPPPQSALHQQPVDSKPGAESGSTPAEDQATATKK